MGRRASELALSLTLALCPLVFHHLSLLVPYSSVFSAASQLLSSQPSTLHSYLLPVLPYKPPTPFLPYVLCSSLLLHLGWQRMPCLSHHLCITSPIQRDTERDRERGMGVGGIVKRCQSDTKTKDHAVSWLNEHGPMVITIEYFSLLLAGAINYPTAHHWHTILFAWALSHSRMEQVAKRTLSPLKLFPIINAQQAQKL